MKYHNTQLKIVMIATFVLVAVFAGWLALRWKSEQGGGDRRWWTSSGSEALEETGGRVLGAFLASRYAGETIGIVTSPPGPGGNGLFPEEAAMLKGLEKSIGNACTLRIVPLAAAADEDPPLWYPAALYDQAFGQCMDCAVIVTLAGLPEKLSGLRFWWRENPPPLVITNSPILQLKKLIEAGEVAGALVRRPWLPGEPEHRGETQWLLVTPENLAEVSAKYQSLFAKD